MILISILKVFKVHVRLRHLKCYKILIPHCIKVMNIHFHSVRRSYSTSKKKGSIQRRV